MKREPKFSTAEQKLFRLCLTYKILTFEDWALIYGYHGQYIRQVLANVRSSNYVSLLIRNFINSVKPGLIKFLVS